MKIKSILFILTISLCLTGCHFYNFFHAYQPPIQQGNIIDDADVARLKIGMNKYDVINIMGSPVLVNTFNDNTINYVYEYYVRARPVKIQKVIVVIQSDRVVRITRV